MGFVEDKNHRFRKTQLSQHLVTVFSLETLFSLQEFLPRSINMNNELSKYKHNSAHSNSYLHQKSNFDICKKETHKI